ncbi:DUF7552 domain-containing protein [Haloarchaeobius sp. TZWWS8]|uniref:DUF7552 domain-containing protein n=1 Tax=Haloarchaeobius sp. TZWWS8 TaxID=3446121 RepID=UPI003EB90623
MSDTAERLRTARDTIEELSAEDGDFVVACALTGNRPAPVTGARFGSRGDAEAAAEATRTYQTALRDIDPDHPRYRPTVYEDDADGARLDVTSTRSRTNGLRSNGLPATSESVTVSNGRDGEWLRMDNAPLIHLGQDDGPFDDDVVARQLDVKL